MSKRSREKDKARAKVSCSVLNLIGELDPMSYAEQNAFVDRLYKQLDKIPDGEAKLEGYKVFIGFLTALKESRAKDGSLMHKREITVNVEKMRAKLRELLCKRPDFLAEYAKLESLLSDSVVSMARKSTPLLVESSMSWLDMVGLAELGIEKEANLKSMREKAKEVRAKDKETRDEDIRCLVRRKLSGSEISYSKVAIYDNVAEHFDVSRSTVQRAIKRR